MHSTSASVLLVDDSADTLDMYAVGLSLAGYQPLTALDAASALARLKRDHPGAVVTDLQLAGDWDGWALIDAIKKDPATREIPIVVLTGSTDSSVAVTASRAGCAAVLTKPCLPDDLADVLQQVLPRLM